MILASMAAPLLVAKNDRTAAAQRLSSSGGQVLRGILGSVPGGSGRR
jgi:hypothetical protein